MSTRNRTFYLGVGLILAAISLAISGCGESDAKPQYRWGVVDRGSVQTVVTATGTANAVTTVTVGSQVSGTIREILVDFNSPVEKGQVIARLDPTFLQAAVAENEANLARAQATLVQAERDLVRIRDLYDKSLGAQVDYDNALTAVDVTKAAVRQAEATLDRARVNLTYSVVRSPIDGVVISRNVDVGQTVAASLQAPTLFTIAQDLRQMQIETNIDEADIGGLREGMEASFTVDSYPDDEFTGKIRQIRFAATVDQNVVTYPVIIDVPNPDLKLRPGMTANVTIVTAARENVLRAPATALRFRPPNEKRENVSPESRERSGNPRDSTMTAEGAKSNWGTIYRKKSAGELESCRVRTGLNNGTHVVILGGEIHEGDSVAVGQVAVSASSASAMPGMGPGRRH